MTLSKSLWLKKYTPEVLTPPDEKENENRFPDDFRFQLSEIEKTELVTNCDQFNSLKHSSVNPYAFTEKGVSMLITVLKSDIAVDVSVKIIRSFVNMRKFISNNALIFQRLDTLEHITN